MDPKTAAAAPQLIEEQLGRISQTFKLFDTRGAGMIESLDAEKAVRALGFEPKQEEINKMVHNVDDDGSSLVGYADFLQMMVLKILNPDVKAVFVDDTEKEDRPSLTSDGIHGSISQESVFTEEKRSGMKWWALLGMVSLLISGVLGVIFSNMDMNGMSGAVTSHPNACQLEAMGGEPAMLTEPWEPVSPQWVLESFTIVIFIIRKYATPPVVQFFYRALPANKQTKVGNYILELIVTPVALVGASVCGQWQLLFDLSAFESDPSVEQKHELVKGAWLMSNCFVPLYILELAFDPNMRAGLVLHHAAVIILCMWGPIVAYETKLDLRLLRLCFAFVLFILTEQNVFIGMLAYYRKVYWPLLYTLSAWYYLVSRIIITILVLWAWLDWYDSVFCDGIHNSAFVYAFFFFIPPVVVILNITQMTTVRSLFGIAGKVRKTLGEHARKKSNNDESRESEVVF